MKKHESTLARTSLTAALACAAVLATGCNGTRAASSTLPDQSAKQAQPAPVEKRTVVGSDAEVAERIARIGEKSTALGQPAIGMVRAWYQLPQANPAGRVRRVTGVNIGFPTDLTQVELNRPTRWAITPANVAEMDAMSRVLSQLTAAGVKLVDVTAADATKLIEAEQKATGDDLSFFNQSIASGADWLISLQQGQGAAGNAVVLGRVVRLSDGALLAVATRPNAGAWSLRPLVLDLVEQAMDNATRLKAN